MKFCVHSVSREWNFLGRVWPDAGELFSLLEKQDGMLSILLAEVDVCKAEIASLRTQVHTTDSVAGVANADTVDEANRLKEVCKSALYSAEQLKKRNEELEAELTAVKAKVGRPSVQINESFEAFDKVGDELSKSRFEIDNLTRELQSTKSELEFAKEACASKQAHIDRINESCREEHTRMANEVSRLQQKLAEEKLRSERLVAENSSVQARLSVVSASEADKDALINDYARRLAEESASRKRDASVLTARLAVLVDENTTLRAALMARRADAAHNNEQSPYVDGLLEDQRALIATLKEECALLAATLKSNRAQYKFVSFCLLSLISFIFLYQLDCFAHLVT
ncbi:unnamed protein product [Toxocara canis]|uniref:HOOK domain-containing protein n=1 Tax=Toxocara canis TaxID=6265 RepID=A0A183UST7_TOXCA|nr:unnamed protein product [Toxocara canis]